jgi:hypothetical protein
MTVQFPLVFIVIVSLASLPLWPPGTVNISWLDVIFIYYYALHWKEEIDNSRLPKFILALTNFKSKYTSSSRQSCKKKMLFGYCVHGVSCPSVIIFLPESSFKKLFWLFQTFLILFLVKFSPVYYILIFNIFLA